MQIEREIKMGRWITRNGAHIYIPDEDEIVEQEKAKDRQIQANKDEADRKNDKKLQELGIPSTMPTKEQLLKDIKKLKGKDLEDAIDRLDSLGSYYREDKRQKRGYLEQVVNNIYQDDPASSWDVDTASNLELIEVVTGVNRYSDDFAKRFGRYDIDLLYERARKKK